MINDIGTPDQHNITADDVRDELLTHKKVNRVYNVNSISSGVNATFRCDLSWENKDIIAFLKINTWTQSGCFKIQPYVIDKYGKNIPLAKVLDYNWESFLGNWILQEYINGEEGTKVNQTERIISQAAKILANLHNNKTNIKGQFVYENKKLQQQKQGDWNDVFVSRINFHLDKANTRFLKLKNDIREFVEEKKEILERRDRVSVTHLDYWWENFIVNRERQEIMALIDWERISGAPHLAGLITAEHYMFDRGEEKKKKKFRKEYFNKYHKKDATKKFTEEQIQLYKLIPLTAEIKGFPYWYRNISKERRKKKEELIRKEVSTILNNGTIVSF